MTEMKLSVIVPVYNAEDYLAACLDSLVAQPVRDMEIILVDDGSRDRSGEICDRFAAADSRVKAFHRSNGGVSSARNFALDRAAGQLITFVDADDYVAPDYASAIIAGMEGCDMLCFQSCWEEPSGACDTVTLPDALSDSPEVISDLLMTLKEENALHLDIFGFPWNKAFRRDIIATHHLRFNPALSYREDEMFVWQYLVHVKVMRMVASTLYHYRLRPGGLTSAISHFTSSDWHTLSEETMRVHGLHPLPGRAYDALSYDVLERMFLEAYSLFREGRGGWNSRMKEICRLYDIMRPSPVGSYRKVRLSLKLRHKWLRALFLMMLKARKYHP